MIPREIIERVRAETDIVGLIGEYVKLKRSGRSFVGLCPFHQEKTPSFNVSPERQAYHCFGCGTGGNAVTFIMNYENVSFPEAIKRLAERLGIRIEYTADDDPTKPLVDALELSAKLYEEILWLPEGLPAQRYLAGRGLKKETVKKFGLGLVPHDASGLLSRAREARLSTDTFVDAGVFAKRAGRFAHFLAGRIVFPLRTPAGRLVGFSGRTWGDDPNLPKYVNTPETRIFKKGQILFGLPEARPFLRRDGAMVVEGQIDVLSLTQKGFHNAVAPLGTAFTSEHARVLARYAEHVTLLFDGDEPGRKAALRALAEVLAVDLDTRLLLLPEGEDPDSFLSAHSVDEFKTLLENAEEPMPFLHRLLDPCDASSRKRAAETMIAMIKKIPDRLRREIYLDEAAKLIKIDRQVLVNLLGTKKPDSTGKKPTLSIKAGVERIVQMMVQEAEFIRLAERHLPLDLLPQGELRELAEKLYKIARANESFTPAQILDELDPLMQAKVSEWSFSEVRYSKEEFARAVAHYIYRRKLQELRRELEDAERSGDEERSRNVLEKMNKLAKESKKIIAEI